MIKQFTRMAATAAILTILFLKVSAQSGTVRFESGLSLDEVHAKALAEHKYLFIDCYATWCAPCKFMNDSIFTKPEVSEFFNSHFINYKAQVDKTANDDEAIKKAYGDAAYVKGRYEIKDLPTYLFFTPDGQQPVYRFIGSVKTGEEFIKQTQLALDSGKSYYTLIDGAIQHQQDSAYLKRAIEKSNTLYDNNSACKIAAYYLAAIHDPYLPQNLKLLRYNSIKGTVFRFYMDHADKIDSMAGDGKRHNTRSGIENAITHYEIEPWAKSQKGNPDWKKMAKMLKYKYPEYANHALITAQLNYYSDTNPQGDRYGKYLVKYVKKYVKDDDTFGYNENAFNAFLYCNDKSILMKALQWSKKSTDFSDTTKTNWNYVDTYANLLYKLGRIQEAIEWEKQASLYTKNPRQKRDFSSTVAKMKKGEKTW